MMSNNNMLWNLLWVSVGGFAGAIARYGLSGGIAKRFPRRYLPYGTLTVNAIGSFFAWLSMGTRSLRDDDAAAWDGLHGCVHDVLDVQA